MWKLPYFIELKESGEICNFTEETLELYDWLLQQTTISDNIVKMHLSWVAAIFSNNLFLVGNITEIIYGFNCNNWKNKTGILPYEFDDKIYR